MISPRSVVITGCNRGIGLELVKHFLKLPSPPTHLIATCRNPPGADELNALVKVNPNIHVLQLDVVNFGSFGEFVKKVGAIISKENGLNLLINNAGLLPTNKELTTVTPGDMMDAYKANCLGPLFLTRALLPLLRTAATKASGDQMSVDRAAVIQMSTAVASIAENGGGRSYAYRCSKTALNMAMKNLSLDLQQYHILVMAMHPGWVHTQMGGPQALISTETCVSGMIDTMGKLNENNHGCFLRYNNTSIPW